MADVAPSKAERLRAACLTLLREHERRGEIPTNGRFLFYELEQRGVIPKKYDGINPKTGNPFKRTPAQDISDALTSLREARLVPWNWITDEGRILHQWRYAATVLDYLIDTIAAARINAWGDEEPPLLLCESRATAGVLLDLAYEYAIPVTATGGQSAGHIVNEVVPLLRGTRRVLYIGDHELRGPAEQIEENARRLIEEHAERTFGPGEWTKIALTATQVNSSPRLRALAIEKVDRRYKPPKPYEAIECEALGQGELIRMIRRYLDSLRRRLGLPPIDDIRAEEERQRAEMRRIIEELLRGRAQ
jgi:hypothetical protein